MTYEEAVETTVSREQARIEIAHHDGCDFSEFLADVGDRDFYSGDEVLSWLGY